MAERVVDLLELVEIDEVYRAHLRRRAPGDRLVHAVAQNCAVRQAGKRIEAREMIDLGLCGLALGDVFTKQHHAAVFHRLYGEFERAAVMQIEHECMHLEAGKPVVELADQPLGAVVRNKAAVDADRHQSLGREPFQFDFGREAEVLVQPLVRHHNAAVRVEHAQAVRHVVERGVEARCEQRHVARRHHGVEQGQPQPLGDEFDREEERAEQHGEDPVIDSAVQQQRRRDRHPRAHDLDDDRARVAEVAAEDPDHVGNRHREADELGERVAGLRERDVAPDAEQPDRGCRARDVAAFPSARHRIALYGCTDARVGAHHQPAHAGDRHDRAGAGQEQRLVGFPEGGDHRADDEDRAGQEGAAVLVEGIDERDIDVGRNRDRPFAGFGRRTCRFHQNPPTRGLEGPKNRAGSASMRATLDEQSIYAVNESAGYWLAPRSTGH